jgi:hypothetical protein
VYLFQEIDSKVDKDKKLVPGSTNETKTGLRQWGHYLMAFTSVLNPQLKLVLGVNYGPLTNINGLGLYLCINPSMTTTT